ncbi:GNAT family N-acetyltransferase [Denitrobaculum tricleocarpae]|uniref:GNAT family N-acetyltransferase n=1 Tax=Denitrobaculum tricleocarpae TaxID=2591009 RepID=A0A545TMH0_9PROT|nr:GNAT family N-acetyltransferase [Denitrobaculum tricleocarpae]TQV78404.1 GNAT family N-acetyltransferase [Denitrobaculum tricleocarpae]
MDWQKENYRLTTDTARFDMEVLFRFISEESYWARGMARETFERAVRHSVCFGLFDGDRQIGFGRVVSDFASVAYLKDVFILEDCRGRGLSKWMMECILSHPDLQVIRRWLLVTADAQELYKKFGFTPLKVPEKFMELHNPQVYTGHENKR